MEDLKMLINQIRKYVIDYREKQNVKKTDFFFLSMLETVANLTVLGIENK